MDALPDFKFPVSTSAFNDNTRFFEKSVSRRMKDALFSILIPINMLIFKVCLQFNIIILAAPDLFTIHEGNVVILQIIKKP